MVNIRINGKAQRVSETTSVAAAIANAGITAFRESSLGESRAPLCGMGICFECRVTINGRQHERSCLVLCREGMEIVTHG